MDGQIKEVVYKGQHNHPKPLPNRRLGLGGAVLPNTGDDKYDGFAEGAPPPWETINITSSFFFFCSSFLKIWQLLPNIIKT
jgi:hypothetical protein